MTEAEKKEIVALVMSEISGQAVDFDLQTVTPQRTDILPAVRPDGAGGYTGVTLDWGGITDELTTQAKEFRNEALQAKKDTELLKGETNAIKSDVEDIYRQFNEAVDKTIESVRNVYQSDLNAEATARQTADNTLQQNIDSEASTRAEADTALGARIDSETTTRESEVAELERVNAIQKYEIDNLKAKAEGKLYRTETVEAEAYALDVPSSVAPYAEVQRIGGKSVVWNQLASPKGNTTINGVSVTFDGYKISIKGTATEGGGRLNEIFNRVPIYNGHIYFVKAPHIDGAWYLSTSSGTKVSIFGSKEDYSRITSSYDENVILGINVSKDSVYDIEGYVYLIDLTQMFGSGNEPTIEECKKIFSADYYPYDAGTLKSFPVKTVKSMGKNLINEPDKTLSSSGYVFSRSPDVDFEDETYTLSARFTGSGGYSFWCTDKNSNQILESNGNFNNNKISLTFSATSKIKKFHLYVNSSTTVSEIQIEKGSVATDYVPYREPIMLDVSSITSDLKSAGSVHDEWSNGKVTKRIGMVDLGTLEWYENFYAGVTMMTANFKTHFHSSQQNILCSRYIASNDIWSSSTLKDKLIGNNYSGDSLYVYDSSFTNAADFKSSMSGVMLYYELDTPTEDTVPEIDNYIEVEGGGTLTFESNETVKIPVPSTTRFVVDLT